MHDDRKLIEDRLARLLSERLKEAVHTPAVQLDLTVWHVDGGPGEPVSPQTALAQSYEPIAVGDLWGPAWGTSWFRLTAELPERAVGMDLECIFNIGFGEESPGFHAEGLVYLPDGTVVKGLNPRNQWIPVDDKTAPNGRFEVYVEAAANPMILGSDPFRPTLLGEKSTAGTRPLYRLSRADISHFDTELWELCQDLQTLGELSAELTAGDPRKFEVLRAIEASLDEIDLQDIRSTVGAARGALKEVLGRPAAASSHRLSAIGHAHIDSAWLWPLRETVRKVGRTSANVVNLMDSNPDFKFAMSQAQQLAWLKEHRPDVFARVKAHVASGQFIPVGGMWVESDTNMPGSEALARQFVHGKRFFLDEFGIETQEVWLPDSFGYSAALPQLVKLAASKWFLTQKISWNTVNKFPHHTFNWEGIDGSQVFTHFPPIDTYNSDLSGRELAHAVRNFQEKGQATRSLAPFGWGDGGGGPTREMLARAKRNKSLEGAPRVVMETPAEFFQGAQDEYKNPPVWSGELYLEFHRATYTSQAKNKQGNRRSEHLLYEAELWAATAAVRTGFAYPYEALDRIWKSVLLLQFHDILPGTSIAWVHRESVDTYAAVAEELNTIIDAAQRVLAGDPGTGTELVFNSAPHARAGIASRAAAPVPAAVVRSTVSADGAGWVLDNGTLRVRINANGLFTSVFDLANGREVLPAGRVGNLLQMHPDFPNMWDAWDVESFYRNTVVDLTGVDSIELDGTDGVRIRRSFGSSTVDQTVRLQVGSAQVDTELTVDWHETEKFLKLAFPLDIHADRSASEIQYGHIYRPTHSNTSWDAAKFEICAHRWVQVEDPGYGVAIANDSTYGHDIARSSSPDGGTSTTVRLSVLRAPRFPDPGTDQGTHTVRYSLVPGARVLDAVRSGYQINLPARVVAGSNTVEPLVAVDNDAVVVTAAKLADDGSGDVVVRFYESSGAKATATIAPGFGYAAVDETDLLERPIAANALVADAGSTVTVALRPFQIATLRFARTGSGA
ncbi:alpha-mannosidase [Pseudarthrobacter sp. P1]|uniref:alpha-mannosidase n=1 Tax=Pseudarthrobacter sp. P1 TaxID=3418418 RepID=UPI003CE9B747